MYMQLSDGQVFTTDQPQFWSDAKPLSDKEGKRLKSEWNRQKLANMLKPNDTIYTICRHVSRSGMSRVISLHVINSGSIDNISAMAAPVINMPYDRDLGGIKIGGCGMDMGFELVYQLGRALWPKGTPEPHGMRNGEPDSDGGYALKQRWL